MPKILLPLGAIVNTDKRRTLAAFQQLSDELKLGLDVRDEGFFAYIYPLIKALNSGNLSTQAFGLALLGKIENLVLHSPNKPKDWREQFMARWKDCWLAMCTVDQRTVDVARIIAQNRDLIEIYTESNAAQIEHIVKQFSDYDIALPLRREVLTEEHAMMHANEIELMFAAYDSLMPVLQATFDQGMTYFELIAKLITEAKTDAKTGNILVVVGNKALAKSSGDKEALLKISEVQIIAKSAQVSSIELSGQHITVEELQKLMKLAHMPSLELHSPGTPSASPKSESSYVVVPVRP